MTQEVRSSVYTLKQTQTVSNLTTFGISRNILEQEGDPSESLEPSSSCDGAVQPPAAMDEDA